MEMIQGFFLDGVHVNRAGIPIGQGIKFPLDIHFRPADASVSGIENTAIRADLALNFFPVRGIIKAFYGPFPGLRGCIILENPSLD
jgi:hypothetical protein